MFKRKDVQIILWMTFVTVAAWIGFNIYHISVTSTISEELQIQIAPIDPKFDDNTILRIRAREQIEPMYQFNAAETVNISTPEADIQITPTEILSPQITETP